LMATMESSSNHLSNTQETRIVSSAIRNSIIHLKALAKCNKLISKYNYITGNH
jgi:hypothetical protein